MTALEVGARVRVAAAYSVHDGATGTVVSVSEPGARGVQLDGDMPAPLWFGTFELAPAATDPAGHPQVDEHLDVE